MPVIEVHLIEGYDPASKIRLSAALTDAARMVVPAPADAVTVMIHEVAPDGYMRGRAARTPAPALPDPVETVRAYLAAMEARDLDAARAHLGEDFTMTFPGTGPMSTLDELVAWAAPRYRHVKKSYDGFDAVQTPGAACVVYARGTLFGQWPDGAAFDGIRFIDRFELVGGKITRQDVWNDMGEVRAGS